MTQESVLAYAHLLAILSLVVFLSSEAALCRVEWMNEAVVRRLGRLDLIYGLSALAVLLSGLARIHWGMKGGDWYWGNPWLHAKLALLVLIAGLSLVPTRRFIRWRKTLDAGGGLPPHDEVRRARHRDEFFRICRTFLDHSNPMPLEPFAIPLSPADVMAGEHG